MSMAIHKEGKQVGVEKWWREGGKGFFISLQSSLHLTELPY